MKREMTKKMVVIAALMLLLMIPLSMIEGVVHERSHYRNDARNSIADSWTGQQKVIGPLLVLPYHEYRNEKEWNKELKKYEKKVRRYDREIYLTPEALKINTTVTTDERSRGIYTIPVYTSEMSVSGRFERQRIKEIVSQSEGRIEWQAPRLSVVISDTRGVVSPPVLTWKDDSVEFAPGAELGSLKTGIHASLRKLDSASTPIDFSFNIKLRGMETLQFSPVGKHTDVTVNADWPHPSFIGRYLPDERQIDDTYFNAHWSVSSFSSSMPQLISECEQGICNELMNNAFGVTLFNSVDIYQQSERSVKYAMLFITLGFVAFFLFEIMKGLRLHPMQYLLMGLGLSVFYLLLISLSEHIAFAWAYLTAALASTAVMGLYLSGVLRSVRHSLAFSTTQLMLYAMLFSILRSEDNSLLMGALLIFAVLSLVMVVTRRFDWYAIGEQVQQKVNANRKNELPEVLLPDLE